MPLLVTRFNMTCRQLLCFGRGSSADLGERGGSRGHQDLTHSVVEALHGFIINTQETLGGPLFGYLHMQTPQKKNLNRADHFRKYVNNSR